MHFLAPPRRFFVFFGVMATWYGKDGSAKSGKRVFSFIIIIIFLKKL